MNYRYGGALLLQQRKPYSFAPFAGLDFLDAFAQARQQLFAALGEGEVATVASLGLSELRAEAERRWREAGQVETAWLLEHTLLALGAPQRLYRRELDPDGWALAQLERLLTRYEAFGRVFDRYDAQWRRVDHLENTPAVIARLALAAGWLATSCAAHDPAATQCHCNVLLKLLDLASAGLAMDLWHPNARERMLLRQAAELEQRLIRTLSLRAQEISA